MARLEGIIPALESAHAIAEVMKAAPSMTSEQVIGVNLSGRGDKDVNTVAETPYESLADLALVTDCVLVRRGIQRATARSARMKE